ncbi:MAG TPA: ABC transporter permease [Terriglobales bacterium]|nr:ABC transporter permease [Terriglobales bacterium]
MWERLRTWGSRLWAWARMRPLECDFAEELESHAALLEEEHRRRGLPEEQARRQARLQLGGITQLRESFREQRGLPLLERMAQDLRYALRIFRKSPGFTLFAGAALALGIGATSAVFNIADAVLLRPLPYRHPSRLVMLWQDDTVYGFPRNNVSPWAFQQWRQHNQVLEDMAALTHDSVNLLGQGDPQYLHADTVTANFFSVLGVRPALGRAFTAEDGRPGAPLTVVLTYGVWARLFGAQPQVVGRELLLNGAKYTVAGVMPRGFQFLDPEVDLWLPAQWTSAFVEERKSDHFLTVVARVRPGVTEQRAGAAMTVLGKQLATADMSDMTAVVVSMREQLAGDMRPTLLLLLGAVALLLLIACADVANLLLARGSTRASEMAVRLALGASRKRVIEQLLAESVLLSCAGGAAGLALAVWATGFLGQLIPPGISHTGAPGVNAPLLVFATAVSCATGVLFGILPAWRGSRLELVASLKQGGGRSGAAAAGKRLRSILVVSELALAMVLLAGAALMIRSFQKLYHQDPGFRAQHVLTLQTRLQYPKYQSMASRSQFYRQVLQRVETLPGVVAAGYTTYLPLADAGGGSLVTVENHPVDPKHRLIANVRVVSPDYFRTVGMTRRQGRLLDRDDGPESPKVAVINQSMAHAYWPGENPVGRRFKRGYLQAQTPWYTVVGIVADMRQGGMDVPVRPEAYFTFEQADFFAPDALAVRTTGDPLAITEQVRRQIWAVDREEPVAAVLPLQEMVERSVAPARLQTWLLAGFAGLALLLATLGIYAVLSFTVAQRTQEIGVRLALGARPAHVLGTVMAQGLRLYLTGVGLGLAAALMLSRLVTHLLFGISAADPLSYLCAIVLMAAVTLLACYVPARRALRFDPMAALRYE